MIELKKPHRYLIAPDDGCAHTALEVTVEEISPSGTYVRFRTRNNETFWDEVSGVKVLEELTSSTRTQKFREMSDAPKVIWLHRRASGTLREVWREKPSPLAMFENIPYHRAPTEAEIQEMVSNLRKNYDVSDSERDVFFYEAGIRAALILRNE